MWTSDGEGKDINHLAYCEGIGLPEDAVACIQRSPITETEYAELKRVFYRNIARFQQLVLAHADWRQRFLYLYTRLASEVFEAYQQKGIPADIFWDTFSDQTIWYKNCMRDDGEPGLAAYDWLWRPIRLLLFRLGRLQFTPMALGRPLDTAQIALPAGAVVLDTHVPQGEPLEPGAVMDSFRQATAFFRGVHPVFVCRSWLLCPALQEILPAQSRILQFQQLFHILETDEQDRQAEERIFGKPLSDPADYAEHTSLQRAAKQYLLDGNKLGASYGVYFPSQFGTD